MLYWWCRLSFGSIQLRWIGIGPEQFTILGNDGTSMDLIIEVDVKLILFVNHRQQELANVVRIQC